MSIASAISNKSLVFNYSSNTSSTDVIRYISEDLVIHLNSYEKFVHFYDAFTQDPQDGKYRELPKAAEVIAFTPAPDGNAWTIKGELQMVYRNKATT